MNLESLLPHVKQPSRYLGLEHHAVRKPWDSVSLHFALVFPDLYEIGMSHHGLQILYHILNGQDDLLVERAYAPDIDMERLLAARCQPLFSLESWRPLADFDVIGITLPYELCYTNILTILDRAGIPFYSRERDSSQPLIIGGGSASFNPEPMADFFDAILLGDGEEAILDIARVIQDSGGRNGDRDTVLHRLAEVDGVYVPSFFSPRYDADGDCIEIRCLKPGYNQVRRRVLADMETAAVPQPPLVSFGKIVHDRLGLEVARGCTRGCRFCQAGIVYRPVRERSRERIMDLARSGIAAGGFDELALLSLSTGDYGCLSPLVAELMDYFSPRRVSVAMPSMRVGTLTPEIMAHLKRVRKTGFTVAPEAGTDRLRQVINKGITEADLLATCEAAFGLGWKLMKFYFMIGLPTETRADIEAIPELAIKALRTAGGGCRRINVSVTTFVPKPHTPFQWEPQISIAEAKEKFQLMRAGMQRHKTLHLKWHDPEQSFLEGVLSRGDRRLARVLERAWRNGSRLDGWSEHFKLSNWLAAGSSEGIDLGRYLRGRDQSEILPWSHLDTGVTQDYLQQEVERSSQQIYTPDCRNHSCQNCGVCDFKIIKPVVHRSDESVPDPAPVPGAEVHKVSSPVAIPEGQDSFFYRVIYSRLNAARFLGHLELMQLFFRAFNRAGLHLHYSQGFNPSPKVSFGPALPVGTESMVEYLEIDLAQDLTDPADTAVALNREMPPGLTVTSVAAVVESDDPRQRTGSIRYIAEYRIALPNGLPDDAVDRLQGFNAADSYLLARTRKGRVRQIDVRPLVRDLTCDNPNGLRLTMVTRHGSPSVKPMELLGALLGLTEEQVLDARVCKIAWQEERGE